MANILSQFRMIEFSKWRITHDTAKFHRTGNADDLCYEVTTSQGYNCKFSLNPQGLHVRKIKRRDNNVFGTEVVDNLSIFGGSCNVLMEDSSDPDADLAGVTNDSEVKDNNESDRSKDEADDSLVTTRNDDTRKVAFVDAIDTVEKSRLRFSK